MRTKIEIQNEFNPTSELEGIKSFFLVGIGGAGVSGIARLMLDKGLSVRGSDSTESEVTDLLHELGVDIQIGHKPIRFLPGEALVVSDAIDLKTSPEVLSAREQGAKLFRRSQALAFLLKGKKVIAVTGTHGKTTTTGLVGAGLLAAGCDPTIVVGAEVAEFGGAVRIGQGEWAVIEACEAYDGYLDLEPEIAVLTNLELDHVDFHSSWEGLKASMAQFFSGDQKWLFPASDTGSNELNEYVGCTGQAVHVNTALSEMHLMGEHNRMNASLALQAIKIAGADAEKALEGIKRFRGSQRRLEVLLDTPELAVVDDYAHHPTEIDASIQALRERFPDRRLVVVYQPHLYSRTAPLISEFAASLSKADYVVMTDIYPAREAPMPGISSFRISELIQVPNDHVPLRQLLPRFVNQIKQEGDVIVGMGAGNISEFAPDFIAETRRQGLKIAVVCGGDNSEREVSLHSGRAVHKACVELGYDAQLVDVSKMLFEGSNFDALTGVNRPDVAVLMVHGTHNEGGGVQGLFELLHIPFSGSSMAASAVAMDKEATKRVLETAGLPVPMGIKVSRGYSPRVLDELQGEKFVVKPNKQGSTVGLTFVHSRDELESAIENALHYDTEALVEQWIVGTEISVPVMAGEAFPVVEIVPQSGQYDFAAKYLPGATDEICPARISDENTKLAQDYAIRANIALGCEGVTRTDMIVTETGPVILEVNTLPGMTPTSLVPFSANAAGISFNQLVKLIVEDTIARKASS